MPGCNDSPLRTLATLAVVMPLLAGCATPTERFIAEMDAAPPDERIPNWEEVRALAVREAPQVGDPAPDFELPTFDGTGFIRLSQLQGKLPVVLVFGSWT